MVGTLIKLKKYMLNLKQFRCSNIKHYFIETIRTSFENMSLNIYSRLFILFIVCKNVNII